MAHIRILNGCQENQLVPLGPPGPYLFGRALENDFRLLERHVSRRHFSISVRDDGHFVRDLSSSTGTFVNGQRNVHDTRLRDGDNLQAGGCKLRYEASRDTLVGRRLGGYEVLERIGQGATGTVYRAHQRSLDRTVALKILRPHLATSPAVRASFLREARAAAGLSHPHIVRVYDVDFVSGFLFYSMEFMAQGSVEDLIFRRVRLDMAVALHLCAQAAAGLEYAEEIGVIHRDIKPANLLLGEDHSLKIGDLGIATALPKASPVGVEPQQKEIVGSPQYMPPEQILGRSLDSRADLYSLGVTFYEMLVGAAPFRGRPRKQVLAAQVEEEVPALQKQKGVSVTPDVSAFIERLLAKSPDDRPPNAAAAHNELSQLLQAEEKRRNSPQATRRERGPELPAWLLDCVAFSLATLLGASLTLALLRL